MPLIERKNWSSYSPSSEARSQEEMKSSNSGSCQQSCSLSALRSRHSTELQQLRDDRQPGSPFCEVCFLFWNI